MGKLLSDVELRLKINNLTKSGLFPDEVTTIIKLINSQKQAHGEMVIGRDDFPHLTMGSAGQARNEIRNQLRDEQRQRNSL